MQKMIPQDTLVGRLLQTLEECDLSELHTEEEVWRIPVFAFIEPTTLRHLPFPGKGDQYVFTTNIQEFLHVLKEVPRATRRTQIEKLRTIPGEPYSLVEKIVHEMLKPHFLGKADILGVFVKALFCENIDYTQLRSLIDALSLINNPLTIDRLRIVYKHRHPLPDHLRYFEDKTLEDWEIKGLVLKGLMNMDPDGGPTHNDLGRLFVDLLW